MLQIPLSDLAVAPGRAMEWAVRAPSSAAITDEAKLASYNQQKHFSAALAARAENAPEKNWVAVSFELPGALDQEALESALYLFVRRHEVLRCTFDALGDDLLCHVIPADQVILDRVDVGAFASTEETLDYLGRRFNQTINALSWPLFLMGVVVRESSSTVYMAFDHIVCDGMSLVMAVDDVRAGYEAISVGGRPELPEVGSYLDFGDAQRERYADLTADGPELAYWRRFIAGNGDLFPRIPLDFGVGDVQLVPATNETIQLLDDARATELDRICRGEGAKVFMGLLAAVGLALHELTGLDVYRGLMPIGERRNPAWRQAFGWFVNTMPIAFPVDGGRDFRTVLGGVRDGFAELIQNVDVPFIKAWELLAPHYYGLRMWPFPVNFFSFLDFRKLPGAEHAERSQPRTIPEASHSNTGNMWFFRNADGVFLNTIFPDTPRGHQAMTVYRTAIVRILRELTDPTEALDHRLVAACAA